MGYYTRFALTMTGIGPGEVHSLLEFKSFKNKPLAEALKIFPDALDHVNAMQALENKLRKLIGSEHRGDYHSAEELIEAIGHVIRGEADEWKWYGHEEDMKVFSRLFPQVMFRLSGEGEEPEDLWVKYFQAGKMQNAKARISYDEFDPALLR